MVRGCDLPSECDFMIGKLDRVIDGSLYLRATISFQREGRYYKCTPENRIIKLEEGQYIYVTDPVHTSDETEDEAKDETEDEAKIEVDEDRLSPVVQDDILSEEDIAAEMLEGDDGTESTYGY